jgi:hypothetical protein
MPSLRFVPPAVGRNAGFALLATVAFVGAAVLAGASGCGSSSASGGADAGKKKDSGVPVIGDDDDDDDSGQDAGLGDDDDGGDASLLGPSYGSIALAQTATSAGAYSYTLTVGFASTSSGTGCTTKTLTPACVLTSCPASTTAPPSSSAGVVTVRDGTTGTSGPTATATPSGSSYPAPTPVTGQLFEPGDLLSASAAGASGGIAAFSAQAIAPNDIQVTTPSFTGLSFPRSQPLTVAWGNGLDGTDTAGDSTKVQVVVATTSTSAVKTITCSFSAAELSGAVPLSGADGTDYVDQAGAGGVTGTISLTPTSTTEAVAGTRAVTFVVTATGAAGSFTTSD